MNLAIIGANEMAAELYGLIVSCNEKNKFEKVFFVDLEEDKNNNTIAERDFFTTDRKGSKILIAMGEPFMRKKMLEKYTEKGFELATFIHPLAFVSNHTIIECGSIVLPHTYIAQNTTIGKNVILHSGSKVENDCTIGDNCFISCNAFIGAKTVINDTCFLGPSTSIRDSVSIGSDTIIGMGAVVTKSFERRSVCFGNPAVKVRENKTNRVF